MRTLPTKIKVIGKRKQTKGWIGLAGGMKQEKTNLEFIPILLVHQGDGSEPTPHWEAHPGWIHNEQDLISNSVIAIHWL